MLSGAGAGAADRHRPGKEAESNPGNYGERWRAHLGRTRAAAAAAMAQCVQSVQEFIQDSFVPLVAALCSEEAERLTRRNNLSFAELVRPFCRLTSEGRCRERSALFTRGGGGGAAAPFRPRPRGSRTAAPAGAAPAGAAPAGRARLPFSATGWPSPGAVAALVEARVCRGCRR